MIKTSVRCEGKMHEIVLSDKGQLSIPHTDDQIEAIRAAVALGAPKPRCFEVLSAWTAHQGRRKRTSKYRAYTAEEMARLKSNGVADIPEPMKAAYWTMVKRAKDRAYAASRHNGYRWGNSLMTVRGGLPISDVVTFCIERKNNVDTRRARTDGERNSAMTSLASHLQHGLVKRLWLKAYGPGDKVLAEETRERSKQAWDKKAGSYSLVIKIPPNIRITKKENGTLLIHLLPEWWRTVALPRMAIIDGTFIMSIVKEVEGGTLVIGAYNPRDGRHKARARYAIVQTTLDDNGAYASASGLRWLKPSEVKGMLK